MVTISGVGHLPVYLARNTNGTEQSRQRMCKLSNERARKQTIFNLS